MQHHRFAHSLTPQFSTAMLLCVSLCLGCSVNTPVAKKKETLPAIAVKTVNVAQAPVRKTSAQPATIHAYFEAAVRAQATGYVKEIKVDIGDVVRAGDELAVIDVPDLREQLEVMRARIVRYQAQEQQTLAGVELAKANVLSSEAKLAQSKSESNRADAAVEASQSELARILDLVERKTLQGRLLDEAKMKRDSDLAEKAAMSSAIDSAAAEVAVAKAKLVAAEAAREAAQADTEIARRELRELEVQIGYATLKAPFDGIVSQRILNPGDLVRSSSEVGKGHPVFVISQTDRVRVRIPVPESDAPLVNRGDAVTLTFPSFGSTEPITGSVSRRSGSLDPSTRTMLVEVDLDNPDGKLLAGMFGQATIELATKVDADVLPARAVRFTETGQAYVYVVGEDDTISIVNVQPGSDDGNAIEILAGLQAGQRVVDSHLKRFSEGQKVTVLNN